MKHSNIKSGFVLSYIAIFIQSLINLIYTPVMLRLLGSSDYGLLQIAISTIANLSVLSFGFGSSYLRFYSKYRANQDNDAIASLNCIYLIIFAIASFMALTAGLVITLCSDMIFSHSLSSPELSSLKPLLAIMTVNLAFSFLCNVFDSYIISQEKFTFQKLLLIITSLLNPILTLPLLLWGKGSVSVAMCMTLITFIKLLSSMLFCIKRLNMKFKFSLDMGIIKPICIFSVFIFLNMISDQINWNTDKTILGIVKGSSSVTSYSLGSQFNSYFLTFSYVLTSLFSPRAYRIAAKSKDSKALSSLFARFGRIQLSVMGYIFMLLLTLGKPFIRLWSGLDSDIPYYTAVLLISPLLVTSIQSIGIEIQRAMDLHRFRSVLYFLIAIGNILVSIPLCIRFGELGCAAGTCACLIIGNILIMNVYYHKKVGLNILYFWKEILRLVPSFIIPVTAMLILRRFAVENISSLILCGVLFTACYAPSVWFLGIKRDIK